MLVYITIVTCSIDVSWHIISWFNNVINVIILIDNFMIFLENDDSNLNI